MSLFALAKKCELEVFALGRRELAAPVDTLTQVIYDTIVAVYT